MKPLLRDRALNREILRLSIPSILANLTVPLVGIVDTAVAGHLHGAEGAAAFIGGISVGAMLLKVAWNLLKISTGELTDSSLPAETEGEIEAIICSFPQVREPHNLRTRRIGNRIAIEAHVRLDGEMPVRDAHEIVSGIEGRLRDRFGRNTLVTIHMEPIPPSSPSSGRTDGGQ